MTDRRFDYDLEINKAQLMEVLSISDSQFADVKKRNGVVESGNKKAQAKLYWAFESIQKYQNLGVDRGKQTAASMERREVQNSLDQARQEEIELRTSIKRGETAPTAVMREVISRHAIQTMNSISGLKPKLRAKYAELIPPAVLDEIDADLSKTCDNLSNLNLDELMDLSELVPDDE